MNTASRRRLLRFDKRTLLQPILYSFALASLLVASTLNATRIPAAAHNADDAAQLLEVGGKCASLTADGKACAASAVPPAPARLKIVSYNIRWRSGDELQEIIRLLKADAEIGGAGLIGLQEVDRNRTRSDRTNTARRIAEALNMNYVWAAPPLPPRKGEDAREKEDREEETGVAILSPYPLADVTRIVLPHEGPGGRRRAAVGATVNIGGALTRVYSVHAETRVSSDVRTEQLRAVLDDLARYDKEMPAVVLGDFNSWQPDSKRDLIQLFAAADFATPFPPGQATYRHRFVKMRLDWIWLRGFAPANSFGIARRIEISDHYPLWLETSWGK